MALFVFDVTSLSSFHAMEDWFDLFTRTCAKSRSISYAIVGTKSDLVAEETPRAVDAETMEEWMDDLQNEFGDRAKYFESKKDIAQLREWVVCQAVDRYPLVESQRYEAVVKDFKDRGCQLDQCTLF